MGLELSVCLCVCGGVFESHSLEIGLCICELITVLRGIGRGHDGYGLAPAWVYSKRDSLSQKPCELAMLKDVGKTVAQSGKMAKSCCMTAFHLNPC